MIVEDHRYISCGGDPFNYLRSVFKALSIDMDQGQEAKIMIMTEKFPYERRIFESLATTTKLEIHEFKKINDETHIIVLKPMR
ncbi:hypothetical protein B1A_03899 [mine drainage metagenome]|uniref:Uncharacterized protein n=1 Tax=mine drainage metagenome TaxID=410659 RepID=T1C449_9ZZZZ